MRGSISAASLAARSEIGMMQHPRRSNDTILLSDVFHSGEFSDHGKTNPLEVEVGAPAHKSGFMRGDKISEADTEHLTSSLRKMLVLSGVHHGQFFGGMCLAWFIRLLFLSVNSYFASSSVMSRTVPKNCYELLLHHNAKIELTTLLSFYRSCRLSEHSRRN